MEVLRSILSCFSSRSRARARTQSYFYSREDALYSAFAPIPNLCQPEPTWDKIVLRLHNYYKLFDILDYTPKIYESDMHDFQISVHLSTIESILFAPFLARANLISFLLLLLLMQHGLWSSGASDKNKSMVEQLQRYGVIRSTKVAEVMEAIDRGLFVPPGGSPYHDSPMPIGYNATISAPHMHAACLELLEKNLQPGMRALDVGSGTGYLTACFALMVGPEGRAVGVEHIPELVATSTENIKKSAAAPQLNDGSLSIHVADGREGWPELAPYEAIHVGAAAPQIPEALIEQLKPGGRMVIPVGTVFQELKVVDKKLDGTVSIRDETSVRYVPLTSKDAQLHAS